MPKDHRFHWHLLSARRDAAQAVTRT